MQSFTEARPLVIVQLLLVAIIISWPNFDTCLLFSLEWCFQLFEKIHAKLDFQQVYHRMKSKMRKTLLSDH